MVVTSSMAAVTDEPDSDHTLTEADWNVKSSLDRNPYYYAKTLAEKSAWDFMAQRKPFFDLVAINPFMVVGPSLTAALNTSNRIFVDLLKGTYPGILSLTWGFVDVRDVADAHVRALGTPSAHGRYLCAGDTLSMRGLVALLAENGYAGYRLPKRPLDTASGNLLVRLLSFTQAPGVGSYLRSHVGRVPKYNTAKIRTELGISFRAVERQRAGNDAGPRSLGPSAGPPSRRRCAPWDLAQALAAASSGCRCNTSWVSANSASNRSGSRFAPAASATRNRPAVHRAIPCQRNGVRDARTGRVGVLSTGFQNPEHRIVHGMPAAELDARTRDALC